MALSLIPKVLEPTLKRRVWDTGDLKAMLTLSQPGMPELLSDDDVMTIGLLDS